MKMFFFLTLMTISLQSRSSEFDPALEQDCAKRVASLNCASTTDAGLSSCILKNKKKLPSECVRLQAEAARYKKS